MMYRVSTISLTLMSIYTGMWPSAIILGILAVGSFFVNVKEFHKKKDTKKGK